MSKIIRQACPKKAQVLAFVCVRQLTEENPWSKDASNGGSNGSLLSRERRRAAGIPRRQKLMASTPPGRIVVGMEANASVGIVNRGKLKVWTGAVLATPIEEVVEQSRHYSR